jgi:outer membrane receptor protein involved in Fe transport
MPLRIRDHGIAKAHQERWSHSYAALFQADNYYLMPAHGLWDASLAYEADKWLVQSYVNNFTNKVYYAGIGSITGGAGGSTVFYGAPRQYGLRVSRSF